MTVQNTPSEGSIYVTHFSWQEDAGEPPGVKNGESRFVLTPHWGHLSIPVFLVLLFGTNWLRLFMFRSFF